MADFELDLPFNSPMKRTTLLQSGGNVFFSVWKPPQILLDGQEKKVRTSERDQGTLDFIAEEELGTRELAWAIAQVNQIYHVPRDVVPKMVVTIPHLVNVLNALQDESGDR
jgi:hypothetical protein